MFFLVVLYFLPLVNKSLIFHLNASVKFRFFDYFKKKALREFNLVQAVNCVSWKDTQAEKSKQASEKVTVVTHFKISCLTINLTTTTKNRLT